MTKAISPLLSPHTSKYAQNRQKYFKNPQTETKKKIKISKPKPWSWDSQELVCVYQSTCLYLDRTPEDAFMCSKELDKQINEDGDDI